MSGSSGSLAKGPLCGWPAHCEGSGSATGLDFRGVWSYGQPTMAKTGRELIKLESTADTGTFYVTDKNRRTMTQKLELMKYDPKVRKHVKFVEKKIK